MDFEHLELHIGDTFARLTLNRPDRRNALSLALMREMLTALDAVADGKGPVLVIEGRGPAFSAGHDLGEIVATREAQFYEELFGTCVDLMTRLHTIPQPVIAKVHGVATAAGCQLVAACDLAIASDDARFATPGVNIGLFCSTPMVPVARTIGRKRALEMLFTGDMIDARTAGRSYLSRRCGTASTHCCGRARSCRTSARGWSRSPSASTCRTTPGRPRGPERSRPPRSCRSRSSARSAGRSPTGTRDDCS